MDSLFIFLYAITIGYSPIESDRYCDSDFSEESYSEYVLKNVITTNIDIALATKKEFFYIGAEVKNICKHFSGKSFLPIENEYIFKTGSRIKKFEIGYEHSCTHPIGSLRKKGITLASHYGAYDRFFVSYSNR